MRHLPAAICLAILCSAPHSLHAETSPSLEAILAARQDLQMAKLEFRNYWQIEYPRLRRHLDAAIRLTEAEIRAYKERMRLYRPFNQFSTGSAVALPLQDLRLCLLEAELRLRDLWAERSNLVRFRTPDWLELEQRVQAARLRVAELEAAVENAAANDNLPGG